jgi:hypothetical protein
MSVQHVGSKFRASLAEGLIEITVVAQCPEPLIEKHRNHDKRN